jgi:hypothetical protein
LNAQLIVQITAVTAITNHVNFIYKRHTKKSIFRKPKSRLKNINISFKKLK